MRAALLMLAALSAASAQPERDPVAVLARARAKLIETLNDLPRYTCVQTMMRSVYQRPVQWPNCNPPARDSDVGELALQSTDRLRLDVAVTGNGREIYSWAGASEFQTQDMARLVGVGVIGTGAFGPFPINIFANDDPILLHRPGIPGCAHAAPIRFSNAARGEPI